MTLVIKLAWRNHNVLLVSQAPEDNDDDYTPGAKKARKPKTKKRKADSEEDSDEDWGKKKKVEVGTIIFCSKYIDILLRILIKFNYGSLYPL